ncbi:RNA-binding protein [Fusobacterium necrophorum subsp. funduliforme]|mgnify:CR=1 FL=1|uniref:S4 domain protein n=4 Tax=Fusobacterium necrophorum TaxID=859 RepID=A0AAN3VWG2_9FUSO|nr:RNA-binding S4 domain-containing protein [Fusobacterium necrophorum]AYV92175.1 RNA-binding S4 domain-containing protein [Fusobacterium necrophorum subsp. funduliforme]AYV94104.1 RNA-binding S4 domain-containing protein [Fusobacterium necrophorum subsp. funduliforme]EFS22623.1 S4 domain protein [Fusobacterium necrophorum D12]EIJ69561.1 S4 domain protein [Fusobacterium necrophorum subsp. funduliforme ATCC 51357]EJU18267.1 S4 domain protein [Fusobacterium necrophorum subsp. funduliforme Fnf 10
MKEEKVVLKTEFITLNQLLKLSGASSNGAEAKYMILDGKVKVNGEIEIRRGKKIRVGDYVEVEETIYRVE